MRSFLALFFIAVIVSGHARFKIPGSTEPRSDSDGLKVAPCGGIAATDDSTKRTVLVAGTKVELEWIETINHPGYFEISFSPDGSFGSGQVTVIDEIEDTQDTSVIRSDPMTWHQYRHEITVPSTTCEACSLRLIQVMQEDPDNPRNYYSCADIRIVEAGDSDAKPEPPSGFTVEFVEGD